MSVVIAVGSCLAGAVAWFAYTEWQRRHLQAVHLADIKAHLVIWPDVDQDLEQPGSTEAPLAEPPTGEGSTAVLPGPRRTVTLSGAHPQRHGAPKHRRVA